MREPASTNGLESQTVLRSSITPPGVTRPAEISPTRSPIPSTVPVTIQDGSPNSRRFLIWIAGVAVTAALGFAVRYAVGTVASKAREVVSAPQDWTCSGLLRESSYKQAEIIENMYHVAHPSEPINGMAARNAVLNVTYECGNRPEVLLSSLPDFRSYGAGGGTGTTLRSAAPTQLGVPGAQTPQYVVPTLVPTASATPGASQDSYQLTLQVGPSTSDCVSTAYGKVQAFLARVGCSSLSRSLYTASAAGRPVLLSLAHLTLADPSQAQSFVNLATSNGTGDIRTLVASGQGTGPDPSTFAADPTFLAQVRSSGGVDVVEAMWSDGGPTHEKDPQLVAIVTVLANTPN